MRRIILLITLSAVMVSMAAAVHKTAKTKKRKPVKSVQTAPPRPDEWALVNVAAACLRTEPSHLREDFSWKYQGSVPNGSVHRWKHNPHQRHGSLR